MARNVFFSFHYDNDVWRAHIVRNSWVTKADRASWGVIDKAAFEELKKQGDDAVKKWIDGQLENTTVTVVLIGSETLRRPFVKYEIEQIQKRKNAIIGVFIDRIKDEDGNTSSVGDISGFDFRTYDWVSNDGYNNLGTWVEEAAKKVGK
jgi:hypothetical protein